MDIVASEDRPIYEPPRVEVLGRVHELTHGIKTTGHGDGIMHAAPVMKIS